MSKELEAALIELAKAWTRVANIAVDAIKKEMRR